MDVLLSKITLLRTRYIFIFYLVVGLLIYGNGLLNGFLGDDRQQILENQAVHSLVNIPKLFAGGTFYNPITGKVFGIFYRPLLSTAFTILYSSFGANSFPFHLSQVLLHIINSTLLFLLFSRFFDRKTAVLLGVVFLLHPINAEAVLYISALQEPLFLFFGLLALLTIAKETTNPKDLALTSIFLFMSILSKETGLLFIFITFFYLAFFKKELLSKFSLITVGLLSTYLLMRATSVGLMNEQGRAFFPLMNLDFIGRMKNVPLIIFTYVKTFIFPKDLAVNQSWVVSNVNFENFILPLIIDFFSLVLLVYASLFISRKYKSQSGVYFLFLFIFIISLGLNLQIIPLDMTYSDRWFYLPVIGLLGMLGCFLKIWKIRKNTSKFVFYLFLMIYLPLLGYRTAIRNFDWKNDFQLAVHDSQINENSYQIEYNLGYGYAEREEYDKAIYHYQRSVEIFPSVFAYTDMATAFIRRGEFPKAEEALKNAVNLHPYNLAYENLSILYFTYLKDYEKTLAITEEGLKLFKAPRLMIVRSLAYYKLNDLEKAKGVALDCYSLTRDKYCQKIYADLSKNLPLEGI